MYISTLSYGDFKYERYLSSLSPEEFEEAKTAVMAMWSGVLQLWRALPEPVRTRKRETCMSLLVMWYLADMYPLRLIGGMFGSGGMPLAAKSIKSVQLQFKSLNLPDEYAVLTSNQFGIKAASMIRYAPEMMGVYL